MCVCAHLQHTFRCAVCFPRSSLSLLPLLLLRPSWLFTIVLNSECDLLPADFFTASCVVCRATVQLLEPAKVKKAKEDQDAKAKAKAVPLGPAKSCIL